MERYGTVANKDVSVCNWAQARVTQWLRSVRLWALCIDSNVTTVRRGAGGDRPT